MMHHRLHAVRGVGPFHGSLKRPGHGECGVVQALQHLGLALGQTEPWIHGVGGFVKGDDQVVVGRKHTT